MMFATVEVCKFSGRAILRGSDNRVITEFANQRVAEAQARRWGYFIAAVSVS
jgi:hypothetical protein